MIPEEKLLRLIRGNAERKTHACRKAVTRKKAGYRLALNILILLSTASALYCVISVLYAGFYLNRPIGISSNMPRQSGLKAVPQNSASEESNYAIKSNNRNIFKSLTGVPLIDAMADNILKDITLVGIVLGENPEAIIEDKKRQTSYRLSVGQFLNDIEICEIKEGRVIIDVKGERFELAM